MAVADGEGTRQGQEGGCRRRRQQQPGGQGEGEERKGQAEERSAAKLCLSFERRRPRVRSSGTLLDSIIVVRWREAHSNGSDLQTQVPGRGRRQRTTTGAGTLQLSMAGLWRYCTVASCRVLIVLGWRRANPNVQQGRTSLRRICGEFARILRPDKLTCTYGHYLRDHPFSTSVLYQSDDGGKRLSGIPLLYLDALGWEVRGTWFIDHLYRGMSPSLYVEASLQAV